MKRAIVPVMLLCAFATAALADEELLIRSEITFHECPSAITAMLKQIGADQNHTRTISDTGAHYYVELEAATANLQFRCNAVSEQIEVIKITPGTLNKLAS